MRKSIFLVLALQINLLYAQFWNPVLVNEKINFQYSDSAYISNTIWVDSAFLGGEDSVFYFNRIVKDVPGNPEIVLRNQPQFLLRNMSNDLNGTYFFTNPGSFVINALTPAGESWLYDTVNYSSFAQAKSESYEQKLLKKAA